MNGRTGRDVSEVASETRTASAAPDLPASNMEVTSELYAEKTFQAVATLDNSNSLATLCFHNDDSGVQVDEDGDLVVPRKKSKTIDIEFSQSTVIPLVGLQIWRGALLLADFILSKEGNDFGGKVVLELAAGVGFTSVVAGMVAKEVISTDIGKGGILDLIQRNINRNEVHLKAETSVLPLDFYQDVWSIPLERKLKEAETIIAADVIYDNDLSEAFIKCLTRILLIPPKKNCFIALEKRFVFTLDDLDVVAPCYDHFLKFLRSYWTSPPMSDWTVQQMGLDFDQKFDYERTKYLVLFKITT